MLPASVIQALTGIASAFATHPDLGDGLRAAWAIGASPAALPASVAAPAELLGRLLPALSRDATTSAELAALLEEPPEGALDLGEALIAWCQSVTWRGDVALAPLLVRARECGLGPWASAVAAARVVGGPLPDALTCVPLLEEGVVVNDPVVRARVEILLWEAGASATEVPALGAWVFGSESVFDTMVRQPAHGALRGRVLAARCLEVGALGMSLVNPTDAIVTETLKVLQPLLLHPEPLVWVHAARAVGRLTSELELLVGTVIDWSSGNNPVLRQRATTAFASMSPKRLGLYAGQLLAMLRGEEDASSLEALALATPYLMVSRRGLWDELVARVLGGAGGPRVASALAKGLGCLWRRSRTDRDVEAALWSLRERARAARPTSLDEARQWLEVTAETDVVEQAERDPLDLERGLENLVRVAAQHDDPEADARAARIASYLGFAFEEARTTSERSTRLTSRAAAMNAVEATARSLAVQLWSPVVATRSPDDPGPEIHLDEAWQRVARGPAQLLELVESARRGEVEDDEAGQLALEVLAVRVGGYVLDACGEATELGPGRGRVVYDTCQWLRRMQGLVDGDRTFPGPLEEALSALLWRLVDSTRGTALGEVNDQEWLGPFAAWWSLVIDRPDVLRKLASALPMMSADALEVCCEQAEALRELLGAGPEPSWADEITIFLEVLHADDTELSVALARLIDAIEGFEKASGPSRELDALCLALVSSAERLNAALTDPMRGLRKSASDGPSDDALPSEATENAPRVASLLGRAVRQRESAVLDVWLPSLVPLVAALVDFAVRGAIRRTPPAPPSRRPAVQPVEGYELVRPLGEGGIGSVWLVRKSGADRLFVLKIPKADALASANEVEREGMLASFVEEAKALAGLYHPNVANISDRGVAHGMPFLVLDYLIGADLKQYSSARLMELHELRQVVPDVCAGLAALHRAGLVHRDIKPANLWLRLPLVGEEGFDPHRHRDPAKVAPLSTVLIDFGMVRAFTIAKEASGRLVAGTPGYIAPEQVLDPAELDARADVYSLVASIYNVTTGRAFFDDLTTQRDKVMAHMKRDPFDDASRLKPFPAAVAKVLRAGTAHAAADRPHPLEFARAFVAAL